MKRWLQRYKFQVTLTVFLLMLLPAVPLYYSIQAGAIMISLLLLALIMLGNLLALIIP